jgi:heme/copper-type cytochrome/quinol oxidase subunit 2
MNDSPRPGSPSEPTEPLGNQYPAYTDPAYAGQSPYSPSYAAPVTPPGTNPTEPLPQYWTQTYGQVPPGMPPQQPPPEPPKSPRWLWIAAGLAVLVVVGLVVALVIVNSNSKQQTVVAPIPAMPSPSTTAPAPTTTRSPTAIVPTPIVPVPTTPPTTTSVAPGGTETVVYEVTGRGRAINITYVDTGSLMQTEFNVLLPWRKEVELPKPAQDSASVTVINVGRDVTCTVTVAGVQVRQRTGAGLTICSASG